MDGSKESFGRSELAIAGGMTLSNFDYLDREGLVPKERDIAAVKRVAVIGAFFAAGVPLLMSAEVASMIAFEFNSSDGEAPANFDHLVRELPHSERAKLPDKRTDWGVYELLRRHQDIYGRGVAYVGDALFEIADRQFVLMSTLSDQGLKFALRGKNYWAAPVGLIENWQRGGEAIATHMIEKLPSPDDPDYDRMEVHLEERIVAGHQNAVGKIVVNVSLAVRRAFDAISDHREERVTKRGRKK